MKKLLTAAIAIVLTALFMSPALAVKPATKPIKDKQAAMEAVKAGESNVPLAQVEYQKKREEAKQKREQMLKLRQQNAGNSGGTTLDEINKQ